MQFTSLCYLKTQQVHDPQYNQMYKQHKQDITQTLLTIVLGM